MPSARPTPAVSPARQVAASAADCAYSEVLFVPGTTAKRSSRRCASAWAIPAQGAGSWPAAAAISLAQVSVHTRSPATIAWSCNAVRGRSGGNVAHQEARIP